MNSAVYTEPITLSATTTVKAISAKANVKSEAASKGFTLLVAPVISGSEIFTGSTQVTLSCETAGATIYYTTDGSTPTTESTEYESTITLSADATVKAISAKNGVSSSVTSKAFSVLETPIISGNTKFEDTTEVTITCDTVGSSIYYTLDGTTPTTSSAEYTAEITLSATTTVKAIAVVGAMSSTVVSQTFSILDYSREYLTIVSSADNNTIGWKASDASNLKTISVSTDGGQTWTNKESSTSGTALATLNNGDKLLIKGSNTAYGDSKYNFNYFTSTENFDVSGNIMSLLYGDNFIGQTLLTGKDYAFINLFFENTKLVNVQNLKLSATTLANWCYYQMFKGCTSLTTTPVLPATTLATSCYTSMFSSCTSLTTAPELPATTLATYCYTYMFYGCTGLTTAPTLPAITLAEGCYQYMFRDCTSLTTAPTLPATTLAVGCYQYMFRACTSLTTAPALPAPTLTNYCYAYMFYQCTSLNYIKCLATNKSATNCTNNWVNGVAASGTFVKKTNMNSWTTDTSGIPSGWTIQNAS